jgi:hypothetical protein
MDAESKAGHVEEPLREMQLAATLGAADRTESSAVVILNMLHPPVVRLIE